MTPTSPVTLSREEALARVRRFLAEWPLSGQHPNDIYSLWVHGEDEPRTLRKDDLLTLEEVASRAVTETPEGLDELRLDALRERIRFHAAVALGSLRADDLTDEIIREVRRMLRGTTPITPRGSVYRRGSPGHLAAERIIEARKAARLTAHKEDHGG